MNDNQAITIIKAQRKLKENEQDLQALEERLDFYKSHPYVARRYVYMNIIKNKIRLNKMESTRIRKGLALAMSHD